MSSDASSKKKTTKGYLVPSRYKQAAKSAGQSSSREKSPQPQGSSHQRSEKTIMSSTLRSMCVEDSRYQSSKKFTSTPATEGQRPLPAIDASIITDEAATANGFEQTLIKNKTRNQTLKSSGPFRCSQKTESEFNSTNAVSEAELNILYAEYLQAKLLESNAKEALEKRSKYISEKLHQIWALMKELMIENAKVYRELQTLSFFNRLHKHLSTQEEMLLSFLEMIPELEHQYESIAQAVDTVRHKLEVKNMSLPNTSSEEEVIQMLQKISDLIQCVDNSEEIIFGAGVADTFLQQGKLVASEINTGASALSEANDILLQETMLKLGLANDL